jgi:fucose permease
MFLACIMAQAATIGLTDIFMNAEASVIEHRLRRPIFTAFHGVASLHMAVFAILSSFLSAAIGPLAACLPAALLVAAAWVAVLLFVEKHENTGTARRLQSIGYLWRHVPLLLMGLAIGLSIAAESAAVFWSAKLVEEQSPELARIYGIGVAFFGGCQALVRFAGDRLRARFGEVNLMLISFAFAAVAFAVLGLAPPLAISAVAFALIGMGLACVSPCLFVLAANESPGNRPAGMAVVSLVAGLPRTIAPLLYGWIAATGGMVALFGFASFIPLGGIAIVLWLSSLSRSSSQNSSQRGVRAA